MNDFEFWTKISGYSWYYQLLQALELAQESLDKIKNAIFGYNINTKLTTVVSGVTTSGKKFTAYFYLSDKWDIPGESVDSLQTLVLE